MLGRNLILCLVLSALLKENAESNEEKQLGNWKINVSSGFKQQTNFNVDGKEDYATTELRKTNSASEALQSETVGSKIPNSIFITKKHALSEAATTNIAIRSQHQDKLNSTNSSSVSNSLMNYGYNHEPKMGNESVTPATVADAGPKLLSSSKNCYNIPSYMSVCPQGFTYLHYNGMNLCYIVLQKQEFPPTCPYLHFLPYYDIRNVLNRYFYRKSVWVHAFRNTTEFGFAHFEWIDDGLYYGRVVTEDIENESEVQDKNCLIFKNKSLRRVSCSEKHSSVCMYSADCLQSPNLVTICEQKGYDECILGDYDLEQFKCYCTRTDVSQPEKNGFCNKLAEPTQPFQTQLLLNYLQLDASTCWFGLHKSTSGGMYSWSSINEEVKYTRWAKPENCGNSEGAFKFGEDPYHGWTLEVDRTLKCAICEFNVQFEKLSLQLDYIASTNEIVLTIKNVASISQSVDVGLNCFSDSNSDDFKQSVGIESYNEELRNDSLIVKLSEVADYPSYYWCEAFAYSSKGPIRSNTVLAQSRGDYGNEFPILVSYNVAPFLDPFINKLHENICLIISKCIEQKSDILQILRPMRAHFKEINNTLEMLLHLTTKHSRQAITEIHKLLIEILTTINAEDPNLTIITIASSEVCISSITMTPDNETLEWPETAIGATAIPTNKLCLDENNNMLPVTRKCKGDFLFGAEWEDPIGTCLRNTTYSETTQKLFDLVHSNAPATEITNDLVQMTQEKVADNPMDVHLVSVALENLETKQGEIKTDKFSTIISNVMHINKETLKEAQHLLNSTDKILSALDNFIRNENTLFLVLPRIIVQVTDLQKSDVHGLALYTEASEDSDFMSYKINQLYNTTSFDNLLQQEHLDTAVLFPADALNDIREQFAVGQPIRLIIMIFYNDFLFNEHENSDIVQQSKTKIISVSVTGFSGQLTYPVRMAFKMPNNYLNYKNCSHWLYGLDPFLVSAYGQWKTDASSQELNALLEICEFSHLTHFGVLLQNDPKEAPYNESVLNILSIIGSVLSLIGIIPIFITAIAFKSWRSRPGNIILINLCIAIVMQIAAMFSLSVVGEDGVICKILGVCVHFSTLSEVCWMFIVAILQYRRFVMVFKPQADAIVIKCLIFGWGFPAILVVITISTSIDHYKYNANGFCSVVGYSYIFGYITPIVLILCSNAFIFIKIIYSVSRQTTETCAQRSRNYKLEILLALFLFFMLGMTWVFGIIGAFGGGVWSFYIFCVTATLRGLVLFLFFIVGNKETRLLWKKRSTYYMTQKLWKSEKSSNVTTLSNE